MAPVAVEKIKVELSDKIGVTLAVSSKLVTVAFAISVDAVPAVPDRGLSETDLVSVPFVGDGTPLGDSVELFKYGGAVGNGYPSVPSSVILRNMLEVVSNSPDLGRSVTDLVPVSFTAVEVSLAGLVGAGPVEFIDMIGVSEAAVPVKLVVRVSFVEAVATGDSVVAFVEILGVSTA